jgi:glycosyltransferase involved in cell wall biosynthesis
VTVVGITTTWNEADIAEFTVRHMLDECDYVLAVDDSSTDRTPEILAGIDDARLRILDGPREEHGFRREAVLNILVERAQVELGATWIVPFDIDEWWYAPGSRIRDVLSRSEGPVISVDCYRFIPQPTDDPTEPNPFRRHNWREPTAQPGIKVVFRPAAGRVLARGNHYVSDVPGVRSDTLLFRHLSLRSLEQAKVKMRRGKAYVEALNEPLGIGIHCRELGALSDAEFAAFWEAWTTSPVVQDPLP